MRALARLLRRDDGVAVATAVWLMFILLLVGVATTQVAIGGLHQSTRDRQVKRALGAADAGADAAQYRLNHIILPQLDGLLNLTSVPQTIEQVAQASCINVTAANVSLINTWITQGPDDLVLPIANLPWCTPETEQTTTEDLGENTSYSYTVSTGIQVLSGNNILGIRRKLLVTGRAGNVTRRILVGLDLETSDVGGLLDDQLFKRKGWVECTSQPTGAAPDSGCPRLPAPTLQ